MFVSSRASMPLLTAMLSIFLAGAAQAQFVVTEDFDDRSIEAIDPIFTFDFADESEVIFVPVIDPVFVPDPLPPDFFGDLDSDIFFVGGITVTFNLAPGERVVAASIDIADSSGSDALPTTVDFIGVNDTLRFELLNNAVGLSGPDTVAATESQIGAITSIVLTASLESSFDNLSVTVIPEPASAMLLMAGVVFFGVRRSARDVS